jgi:hypothetical protein
MNNPQEKFEKVFKCELKGISATLDVCMDYVDQHSDSCPIVPEVRSRLKWAITELLTNAIKHSGAPECTIGIQCNQQRLVLEKTEQGNPLKLVSCDAQQTMQWPITDHVQPTEFEIYQNGADSLWVEISPEGQALFQARPVTVVAEDLWSFSDHIAEHFGLLILTKASDTFRYEFDPTARSNKFSCIFNWNKK